MINEQRKQLRESQQKLEIEKLKRWQIASNSSSNSSLNAFNLTNLGAIAGDGLTVEDAKLAVSRLHNELVDLQGGASGEYYHLTAALYSYMDVTSSIQTQLDSKLALAGGTMTGNITLSNGVYLLLDGGATGQTAGIGTATDISRLRVRAEGIDRVAEFASYGLYCPRGVDTNIYTTGGIIVDYGDAKTSARGLKFGRYGTATMWFDGTDLNINQGLKVDILKSILYDVSLRIKNDNWLYVVNGTDSAYKGVAALNYYGSSTVHSTATTTKILVDDAHYYKYRTASEVATDLGVDSKLDIAGGTITGALAVGGTITAPEFANTTYDTKVTSYNDGWIHIRNKAGTVYRGVAASDFYADSTDHTTTPATKFIVDDGKYYRYRTASEVVSDIGAVTASEINDPYAVGTSGDYYWQEFFSDMKGFSDTITVGASIHYQRPYFYLQGTQSSHQKIYWFTIPVSIPMGWKISAIDLFANGNQYSNLYWSNLTLYVRYVDSSFANLTSENLLDVTNPFGGSISGYRAYHSGETITPHGYTNFKDGTAYNLSAVEVKMTVYDTAVLGTLALYTLALNVKFEKI